MQTKKNEKINKYQNAKIYKIVSNSTDKIYIGSTCKTLSIRLSGHKYDYKRYLNGKFRKVTSFEIVKYDDCMIELIEAYKCNNKEELYTRERFYIESNECNNKYIPGRTGKEYYKDNKDKAKQYYEDHKDKLNTSKSTKFTCQCGSVCRIGDKSKHTKTAKHQLFMNKQHNKITTELINRLFKLNKDLIERMAKTEAQYQEIINNR